VRLRKQRETRRRTASDREERGKKAMEEDRGTDKRDGVNRKTKRNFSLPWDAKEVGRSKQVAGYNTTANSS